MNCLLLLVVVAANYAKAIRSESGLCAGHGPCISTDSTKAAFRSIHGYNMGVTPHSDGSIGLFPFHDDEDPAWNPVFDLETLEGAGNASIAGSKALCFESMCLSLHDGRVQFVPPNAADPAALFLVQEDLVGSFTFCVKIAGGPFLSVDPGGNVEIKHVETPSVDEVLLWDHESTYVHLDRLRTDGFTLVPNVLDADAAQEVKTLLHLFEDHGESARARYSFSCLWACARF